MGDKEGEESSPEDEVVERERMVADYLATHPEFVRKWFNSHQDKSASAGTEIPSSTATATVGGSYSGSVSPTVLMLRNQLSAELRDGGHPNNLGSSLAAQTGSDDTEHLAASYVEMTKGGRNSVTCQLFKEMLAGELPSKIKRNNNSTIGTTSRLSNGGQRSPCRRDSTPSPSLTSGASSSLSGCPFKEHLRDLDEHELFMELIRDISNELDMDTLCHKILVNVGTLTRSDRGSLFLAKGSRGQRYLVAKLFDVTPDSLLEESICAAEQYSRIPIPFGVGIAGQVALTKETIVIKDAYEDTRFNKDIDARTGYRTMSMMCKPILNCQGDVIGVAQCINKKSGNHEFTRTDEQLFARYLTFCGIGIQNAQLFEMSIQEYKRNQLLLMLARSIFEETSSLDVLINKIMTEAQGLLRSEKCRVYLLDTERKLDEGTVQAAMDEMCLSPGTLSMVRKPEDSTFSALYELHSDGSQIEKLTPSTLRQEFDSLVCHQLAAQVALTGQTSNWASSAKPESPNNRAYAAEEAENKNVQEAILSVPILSSRGSVIGVAQLERLVSGESTMDDGYRSAMFTEVDVSTLEAFAIFCGLGIHNTQTYERALKLMAKQKVALEVLSYHASSSVEETQALMESNIPTSETFQLYKYDFCDFSLDDRETCLATLRMFMELQLISRFHIPYKVLCRWILSVKKNYRPVVYHNWRHSLNVTQTMFAMITVGQMSQLLSDLEHLALLVACLCHDLDHRGTNNSYQTKIASPLATLYSTSTMEHHHFDQCIMILNSEGNNILQFLSPEEYTLVIKIVESAILSTDLAQYFKKRDKFVAIAEAGETQWLEPEKRDLLRGMMMTACDVSAISKPWPVQKKIAELVAAEFFQQGDMEKMQLHQQPVPMMDRERKDELPKMQVGFIDDICLPVYTILANCWPPLAPLKEGCAANRNKWHQIAIEEGSD